MGLKITSAFSWEGSARQLWFWPSAGIVVGFQQSVNEVNTSTTACTYCPPVKASGVLAFKDELLSFLTFLTAFKKKKKKKLK